jgi:hypothetical protein
VSTWQGLNVIEPERTCVAEARPKLEQMKKESKALRGERPWAALMGLVVACVFWGLGFPLALGTLPFAIYSAETGEIVALARVPALWALFGALALFATLTPFWLMNRYQPYVLAAEAGVIYGLEPLCASVFALFLPELLTPVGSGAYANEQLIGRLLLGGSLVTLANVLLQIRVTSAPKDHSLA